MTCEDREALGCEEGLAAPMTAATSTTVSACAQAIGAEVCTAILAADTPDACLAPHGAAAAGAPCQTSAQCTTGFCATDKTALCGTCAPTPAAGDSCATSGCGPSMRCVAQTQLCAVPVASGGACGRGSPCADGLACVGATMMMANGTCTAQLATAGAACDPKNKTAADCNPDDGLACDSATNTCVAQPFAAPGGACGALGTVNTRCSGGESCTVATGQTTGTCVAPAADGAACDATVGPGCQFPARCVANVCALPGSISC